MIKYLHSFLRFKVEILFHPESPGIKVKVKRSWIGRLIKPTAFATLTEVLKQEYKGQ
tara:strand:- start:2597 stop:2767 length:171 start_codon:yes stop_codon:yes gene_type:complete